LMLRLARRRLPADGRDDLYDEWSAELHVALHETAGRPLSRLLLGVRYAAGLLRTARRIADELGSTRQAARTRSGDAPAALVAGAAGVAAATPRITSGSTVLHIVLGSELRRLRTLRRITCAEAAMAIRAPHEKVDRIEVGQEQLRTDDIAGLLTLYGVTDPAERRSMLALAAQANRPGWWHKYSESLPAWFHGYVGLEEEAARISAYGEQLVPALLQTEAYARAAAMLDDPNAPAAEIERRLALWTRRQALLHRDDPPHVWAVVDEVALRRPFVGRSALRGQIRHLLDLTDLPHVTVQVLPFDRGGHAGAGGPFNILRFSARHLPDVVHLDQLTSALYLDKREDVDHYGAVMERLRIDAVPASFVRDALDSILQEA